MKPRKPLTPISPNAPVKHQKLRTYGKRARRSFKERASTLFDAAVAQENPNPNNKTKRRVRFSDPLVEEIPDMPFSGATTRHKSECKQTPRFGKQRVNRVLSFDSDDDDEPKSLPQSTFKGMNALPSLIDEARRRLEKENDLEWYPETQPDDFVKLDERPWVSPEDENCSLLLV